MSKVIRINDGSYTVSLRDSTGGSINLTTLENPAGSGDINFKSPNVVISGINNATLGTSNSIAYLFNDTATEIHAFGGASTIGIANQNSLTTIYGNLTVDTNLTVNHDVSVLGNLTVEGTLTTINSTTLTVDDGNLELGSRPTPTDITADGGGITLKGTTDKTITWYNDGNNNWTSGENWNLVSNKSYKINNTRLLTSDTLFPDSVNFYIGSPSGVLTINSQAIVGSLDATEINVATINLTNQITATPSAALFSKINLGIITGDNNSLITPTGTTAQRDAVPEVGYVRFNTTLSHLEVYDGTIWNELGNISSIITSATGSLITPSGTVLQRDNPAVAGYLRFNSELVRWEGYDGTNWVPMQTVILDLIDGGTYGAGEVPSSSFYDGGLF